MFSYHNIIYFTHYFTSSRIYSCAHEFVIVTPRNQCPKYRLVSSIRASESRSWLSKLFHEMTVIARISDPDYTDIWSNNKGRSNGLLGTVNKIPQKQIFFATCFYRSEDSSTSSVSMHSFIKISALFILSKMLNRNKFTQKLWEIQISVFSMYMFHLQGIFWILSGTPESYIPICDTK